MLGIFGNFLLSNAIGLSRFTLRYSSSSAESGFAHHCQKRLLVDWSYFMLLYVLVYGAWNLRSIFYLASDSAFEGSSGNERFQIELVVLCIRVGCMLQGMFHLFVCKCSRLSGCIGYFTLEKAIIFFEICSQASVVFDRYTISKLQGHSDPFELYDNSEIATSDSFKLLSLSVLLVTCHNLPLRWCSLFAVEIMTPTAYALICPWSHESWKWMLMVYLAILSFLAGVGKRQLEINERYVFSSYLMEKTLRMEAEFELSRSAQQQRPDDAASVPDTTCSGEVFCSVASQDDVPANLHALFYIGKKEQWLIDERELTVDSTSCLGSGGFGIVLAGEFHASAVALKIHNQTRNCKNLFDLSNELRLLRKLRHPNIVLLHGACLSVKHKDLVLVMERISGESLLHFVAGQPSALQRCQVLFGTIHGLMYLHTRQPVLVHGDLKPTNIMIEQRGASAHAKLLDFGLARLVTRNARPGGGSLRWLAPEVLGKEGRPSTSGDVYAFGLIVYFTSTGKKPFEDLPERVWKAFARGKSNTHLVPEWPVDASQFAMHCKSIVDLATKHSPSERPSLHQVHAMMLEIEEFKPLCTHKLQQRDHLGQSGVSDDLFWKELLLARRVALAKQDSSQHSLFQHWVKKRKAAEAILSSHRLKPVKEQDTAEEATRIGRSEDVAVQAWSNDSMALPYPTLMVTPRMFMLASVIDIMVSWNAQLPKSVCCEYHGLLRVLSSLVQEMQAASCKRLSLFNATSRIEQCPACFLVVPRDDTEEETEDIFCNRCGFEGKPHAKVSIQDAGAQVQCTSCPHITL
mmetsp:Transcript_139707/g.246971  ORF Transcript_139707/g.246971 Transcript_139707/m.246971 type:complete len:801 (-) Transcript_139707:36-2438(-)